MIRRLLALSVGAVLVVGGVSACGGDEPEPGAGSGGSTAGTGGGAETSGSDDGGGDVVSAVKTCDGYERDPERAAPWPDAMWGSASESMDCPEAMVGNLYLDIDRGLRLDGGYVLRIAGILYGGKEDGAHQVSVSNAEVLTSSGEVVALADVVSTDPSVYAEYLEAERDTFEGPYTEQKTRDGYWDRAFGGPVAFEDAYLDISRLGETFEIGPTYEPDNDGQMDNLGRRWYFSFADSPSAIKFDLTIDGETKTVALDLTR